MSTIPMCWHGARGAAVQPHRHRAHGDRCAALLGAACAPLLQAGSAPHAGSRQHATQAHLLRAEPGSQQQALRTCAGARSTSTSGGGGRHGERRQRICLHTAPAGDAARHRPVRHHPSDPRAPGVHGRAGGRGECDQQAHHHSGDHQRSRGAAHGRRAPGGWVFFLGKGGR